MHILGHLTKYLWHIPGYICPQDEEYFHQQIINLQDSYNHTFKVSKKKKIVKPLVAALFQVMLNGTFRNPTLLNSTTVSLWRLTYKHYLNHAENNFLEAYIIQVLYWLKNPEPWIVLVPLLSNNLMKNKVKYIHVDITKQSFINSKKRKTLNAVQVARLLFVEGEW